jgi:hypothetical protein
MVYLLKFGASWILPPGIFILACFGLAVYIWRRHRDHRAAKILAGITFVFYLLCTGLVADHLMGALESAYEPPAHPQGDVIVLLGGGAAPGEYAESIGAYLHLYPRRLNPGPAGQQ